MHILFITQYFPPDIEIGGNKVFEVSKRLINQGCKVTVVTGFPNYPTGVIPIEYRGKIIDSEYIEGIKVLRSFIYASHDDKFLNRIINQFSFAVSASIFSLLRVSGVDIVIATSPPLLVGIPGFLASLFMRIPFVIEIRDLLPESAIQMGMMKSRALINFSKLLAKFFYKNSDHIIALTNGIQKGLEKYGVNKKKIDLITNGADVDFFKPNIDSNFREKYKLNNKFIVMYTGTFGFIHGFETIIESARILNKIEYDEIIFILIGDGNRREFLSNSIKTFNLKNIKIIPPVSRIDMPKIINAADVCLATTHKSEVASGYIPSKMFEYMACAKPIILGIDGEAEQIIKKNDSGLCVGSENPKGIVKSILKLKEDEILRQKLGLNGRKTVEKQFSRDSISKRYYDVISKVI